MAAVAVRAVREGCAAARTGPRDPWGLPFDCEEEAGAVVLTLDPAHALAAQREPLRLVGLSQPLRVRVARRPAT